MAPRNIFLHSFFTCSSPLEPENSHFRANGRPDHMAHLLLFSARDPLSRRALQSILIQSGGCMSGESVLHLVRRIQNDFLEMSDLRVTLKEAQQLWNMEELTSEQIFEALVAEKFLSRTLDGAFIRA